MSKTASVNKLATTLTWVIAVILVLLPFHAFITVWLSSGLGHYTLLRLWKEFLLLLIALGAINILLKEKHLRQKLLSLRLAKLIAAYFLLLLICGFIALARHTVAAKAVWYGLLIDSRFLVFFLAVLVISANHDWLLRKWRPVILIPAAVVAAFAVLQYLFLPYDLLKHFGYGPSTISPYETINHNLSHIRVASTLRGANPLGAYLIIPISILTAWSLRGRRQSIYKLALGTVLLLALVFSFSRSAWIGTFLAFLTIAWLSLKTEAARKKTFIAASLLLVLAAVLGITLRNNLSFENAVLHTDRNSHAVQSSNQGHSAAFKGAVKDIAHKPLGAGVGSAGPQSVYNNKSTRIAENYYLQIGQEVGVIGMLLFIAINIGVGKMLFNRRQDPLALALLASLIGLSFVNLLSHAWADDTLAYIWWGLAGLALAPRLAKQK